MTIELITYIFTLFNLILCKISLAVSFFDLFAMLPVWYSIVRYYIRYLKRFCYIFKTFPDFMYTLYNLIFVITSAIYSKAVSINMTCQVFRSEAFFYTSPYILQCFITFDNPTYGVDNLEVMNIHRNKVAWLPAVS